MYYIKYLKSGVFTTFSNVCDWASEIKCATKSGLFADRILNSGKASLQVGYSALLIK